MKVPFSQRPGRHERHFRRKLCNPLFPRPIDRADDDALLEVQRRDHEELVGFIHHLKDLVTRAASLPPRIESDVILGLKEELDRAFETASGLADDQSEHLYAVRKLTEVIMARVRKGAQGDALAASELQSEAQAREAHYALLGNPLGADLLHPESLIEPDELAATLLCEGEPALAAALSLFDPPQLTELIAQSRRLLADRTGPESAQKRLLQMATYLKAASAGLLN
ncbi:MAG: hypothetical protein KJ558_16110 [Gammaproteobacteria bacterium]|nr:hypothetical protein [Gammaproteobacteria bacterium]MBU1656314.1 hypothetical protein [Gammaproteobacteria bacterium]MBU1959879.1 hypothetical protein [Gammaproteobacteria bacterium]